MPAPDIPVAGGMLDLTPPVSRCHRCGWEGIATVWRGHKLTECPACEMQDVDGEWLELFELIAQDVGWAARYRHGSVPAYRIRPAVLVPRQSRNSPCACGSGKKFKKCHGR